MDKELLATSAFIDQLRAQLNECLEVLVSTNITTLDRLLANLYKTYRNADNESEKLYALAALVGVTTTMQKVIENG